jgi:Protein of unknown function (DUF2510)
MANAKIQQPLAGLLVRNVGMAKSAMKNAVQSAAHTVKTGSKMDRSTLQGENNGYVAVYPDSIVLYRTKGFLPKPVPDVIDSRTRQAITNISLDTGALAGTFALEFDDGTGWALEFAGGASKQARRLVEALQTAPSAAPPAETPVPQQAAGWFPDASGRHELRYWDGTSWTEHVSDNGAQATDALS